MDTAFINKLMTIRDEDYDGQTHLSLSRTIEKYPYFSLLYYYYAKGSKKLSVNFNENLTLASAYSPDRKRLKEFLETKTTYPYTTDHAQPSDMDKIHAKIEELKKLYSNDKSKQEKKEERPDIIKEIDSYTEPELSSNPTKEELIERFLKIENPKVKSLEKEKENININEVISKSNVEELEIVTETMAIVYTKQGHKDKAIKIYKQLILANPEKSIYFATQIKKIEENK
ncbi:MAG: hypothetical protein WCR29_03175 [Bacteroidales bacterium]|nr:hypothetical protein [Bacteroidales bacterium]